MSREPVLEDVEIREIVERDVAEGLDDLLELLNDAVDSGASVGFLSPLDPELAIRYWRERYDEARRGSRIVLVAAAGSRIIGSVQIAFASQQNASHRGEVQRLLVHRSAQRRGLGTELMRRLEALARARGKTLLFLNTRSDDAPEALYARLGYRSVGRIPDFARNPDGSLNTTTLMYKRLG